MAQGKLKVKTKLPSNVKNKKRTMNKDAQKTNRPIAPKKRKFQEAHKFKKMVTKTVNKNIEQEMRTVAQAGKKNFSQVEQAVANYNNNNKKEKAQ